MFQSNNFISFHDLTPDGNFLWASSSITDCLGYEPEEVVGIPAYALLHDNNVGNIRMAHKLNVEQEKVGTQIITRFICKDGSTKPCLVMFSVCYDYIVTCTTIIDVNMDYTETPSHSDAMTREQTSKKQQEFERIRRHQEAFDKHSHSWRTDSLDPEPRACMILNRFTRSLVIMYASPSSRELFNIDPEAIIGKPLLLFIRADDLAAFVVQMDIAKSTTAIAHMRFWFQSPSCPQEIPCEAMLFGAADGMIMIIRRCRPFVRKPLIKGADNPRTAASASYAAPNTGAHTTPYMLMSTPTSKMRTHHYHTSLDITEITEDGGGETSAAIAGGGDHGDARSETGAEDTSSIEEVLELDMNYPSHYYATAPNPAIATSSTGDSASWYSASAVTPQMAQTTTTTTLNHHYDTPMANDSPRPLPLSLIDLAEQARLLEEDDPILSSELESYDEVIVSDEDEGSMHKDEFHVDQMEWDKAHSLV